MCQVTPPRGLSPARQSPPKSQLSCLGKPSYGRNVLPPHLLYYFASATKCFSNTSLWFGLWRIMGYTYSLGLYKLFSYHWQDLSQLWPPRDKNKCYVVIPIGSLCGVRRKSLHISEYLLCASSWGRCWGLCQSLINNAVWESDTRISVAVLEWLSVVTET